MLSIFLNVGQVNGRTQALISQTVRGNSSSSAKDSDQGWKSEPKGVTLRNRRTGVCLGSYDKKNFSA